MINDCTIIFNEATFTGGGIECDNVAIPILTNTIVCDNTPDQINGNFSDLGGNTIGTDCGIPSSSDIDGDGIVGVIDLLIIIEYWGTDEVHADLDGSGIVDVGDILIIVADWGPVGG
jgi:hypothetical protein